MEKSQEPIILICITVEGNPSKYIYPGSVQDTCADCGAKVWVAPSGQEVKNKIVVCTECGLSMMDREPGEVSILEKSVEEIKAWEKRN